MSSFAVQVASKAEFDAVIKAGRAKGLTYTETYGENPMGKYGATTVVYMPSPKDSSKMTFTSASTCRSNHPTITIVPFVTYAVINGIQAVKPDQTVRLTSGYNAVIKFGDGMVKVGCQSIPFAKVNELAALIKQG